MISYYLDTSALAKRYVDEVGSQWLRDVVTSERSLLLLTSRLAIVEMISAFTRRLRDGSLTRQEFMKVRDAFREDCLSEYQIMPPTLDIVDLACSLLERHPLRAYDAVHLATALSAHLFLHKWGYRDLVFLSSDERLNRAASAEGLAVDNPNHHS